MQDSFLTISNSAEGLYKEKGSKFIAVAFPVTSVEAVKEKLELLRKDYYDARHHCYAYVLGHDGSETRANDDGEPNHSAGDPILGQIKSKNLTNTLLVVVRYFGGTKLGVSGLINAYKTAAFEALEEAQIVKREITETVILRFPYDEMNEVMKLVKDLELNIKGQDYDSGCVMTIGVIVSKMAKMNEKLTLLNDLGHSISVSEL
ncbi:IMPACT family protein [Roseivirga misakiensis]|uniref:YigZ family protein n=1 Tax=Roseivirga misakiensis TaxID=1563681 RepID=A0A1E5SLA1_9BACT|nr:YigZ family protein [Roseivirga misakiensis]OEJ99873.1 YigZ family protein [Roseivirga misakiensis]